MSTIGQTLQSRKEAIEKMTLGTVTNEYFENLYQESSAPENLPEDDGFLSIKIGFEMDEEQIESFKKVHSELVEERNFLVHHRLWDFDRSSSDKCLDLISDLDEQYIRIKNVHESLTSEFKGVLDLRSKAKEWIEKKFDRMAGDTNE